MGYRLEGLRLVKSGKYRKRLAKITLNLRKKKSNTGLPTNDETSETTVRNLHCLFLFFIFRNPCHFELVSFFAHSLSKIFYDCC